MTLEERDFLDKLIKVHGLSDVVDEISAICFDRSETEIGKGWLAAGEYLEKVGEDQRMIIGGK